MGADEIAVFRPALREIAAGGPSWCASFVDEDDATAWVQVSGDLLNFAYPLEAQPLNAIEYLGLRELASLEMLAWEPGKFATLRLEHGGVDQIARIIDRIFSLLLERREGFRITVELFRTD